MKKGQFRTQNLWLSIKKNFSGLKLAAFYDVEKGNLPPKRGRKLYYRLTFPFSKSVT